MIFRAMNALCHPVFMGEEKEFMVSVSDLPG